MGGWVAECWQSRLKLGCPYRAGSASQQLQTQNGPVRPIENGQLPAEHSVLNPVSSGQPAHSQQAQAQPTSGQPLSSQQTPAQPAAVQQNSAAQPAGDEAPAPGNNGGTPIAPAPKARSIKTPLQKEALEAAYLSKHFSSSASVLEVHAMLHMLWPLLLLTCGSGNSQEVPGGGCETGSWRAHWLDRTAGSGVVRLQMHSVAECTSLPRA